MKNATFRVIAGRLCIVCGIFCIASFSGAFAAGGEHDGGSMGGNQGGSRVSGIGGGGHHSSAGGGGTHAAGMAISHSSARVQGGGGGTMQHSGQSFRGRTGGGFRGGHGSRGFGGRGFGGYYGGFYGPEWWFTPAFVIADIPYYYDPNDDSYYEQSGDNGQLVEVPAPALPVHDTVYVHRKSFAPSQAPAVEQEPSGAMQPTGQPSGETVTINIPNYTDSGFTPVVLTKKGNGYSGPQGEYYAGHPTVDQLRGLYGK